MHHGFIDSTASTSRWLPVLAAALASSAATATVLCSPDLRRRFHSAYRSLFSSDALPGSCCKCSAHHDAPKAGTTSTSHTQAPNNNGATTTTAHGNVSKRTDPLDPSPRERYLPWEEYFMALAILTSHRSKDPNKQVGACIVSPDNVILGIGYNGFPRGCGDNELPWAKQSSAGDMLETKYPYVCHAEMNAIMNKNSASIAGATMYVTMFPCNECAKLMIQAGINEVVFLEAKLGKNGLSRGPDPCYAASMRLLDMAGVAYRQMDPIIRVSLEVGPPEAGKGSHCPDAAPKCCLPCHSHDTHPRETEE